MEAQAHLQCFNDQVSYSEVAAAFRTGEEVRLKFRFSTMMLQMKSLENGR